MFRHRPSFKVRRQSITNAAAASAGDPVRQAAWHTCERLEQRRLLATTAAQMTAFYGNGGTPEEAGIATGGGVQSGVQQEATYTYLDANENEVRIALWGNITAEFLFVNVSGTDNSTSVVDPVPYTQANITADAGADLFAVYISSASPTASISIAQVNTAADSGNPDEAFTGSNTITVNNEQSGGPLAVTSAAGAVWLGARLYPAPKAGVKGPPGTKATAVLSVPLTQTVGVRPVSADGTLYPGVVSAPGVSLNRFLLGGTVTGRVDLGGSINTFYAGSIWTGDANGITEGQQPGTQFNLNGSGQFTQDTALNHNFNVAGDIDNLITLGDLGTNGVVTSGKPTFETGFRLSVGGHIGQVKSEADADGSFYAENLPTFKGLGLPQTEVYAYNGAPPADSGESYFEGNMPSFDDLNFTTSFVNGNFVQAEGGPSLADSTSFDDSTIAGAQFLGTPFSSQLGHNAIQLTGEIDNSATVGHDLAVYGVALGADQTITATLSTNILYDGELQLGIFSPSAAYDATPGQDLLASSYDPRNAYRLGEQPITFTSTDAGVYYFAVAYVGDVNFNGTDPFIYGPVDYQLGVTGVKNLGIGAIAATGSIELAGNVSSGATTTAAATEPSIRVDYGDLGALISTSGATIISGNSASTAQPITATTGNIRAIQSGAIGALAGGGYAYWPDLRTPGNVGLIRTTTAGGIMIVNADIAGPNEGTPIGGSYQLIDCAGQMAASLVADGNIGTIRAQTVGLTNYAPTWQVDANHKSGAGVIDLVDVTGANFGTLGAGGPQINTGPGGNVRYIHIDAGATIYNDDFFGGLLDEPITYAAGQAVSLTDDSGTRFTITPYKTHTVSGNASTGTTTTGTSTTGSTSVIQGDTLTLQTYGIEGSGGVAVISVTCTAGAIDLTTSTSTGTTGTTNTGPTTATGPTSISVDTSPNGTKGSVEFGQINMVGGGTTITYGSATDTVTSSSGLSGTTPKPGFTTGAGGANTVAEDDSATFSGKDPIGVYSLIADTGAGALAGMTNVENNTSGEIVNFTAQGVEKLEATNLGVAKSDTGAPVGGATVLSNVYPFSNQRTLIQIGVDNGGTFTSAAGAAETIESTGSLGNILCDGTLGTVAADVGAGRAPAGQQGIVGPIYAAGTTSADIGNIISVNVGYGLGNSGSGNHATTGIFADNYIGTVTNQNGSDIRGDIVASGASGGLPTVTGFTSTTTNGMTTTVYTFGDGTGPYIGAIDLSGGGSIIDNEIYTTTTVAQAIASTAYGPTTAGTGAGASAIVIQSPNVGTNPNFADVNYAIGSIKITGDGGIIGLLCYNGGIQNISVAGFGIVTSDFETLNADVIGTVSAAGYGIRSSYFRGQNSVNSITATGAGKELKANGYPASVRQSETGATVDAYSGQPLDIYDDLDKYLGTSAKKTIRKGATEAGVIADTEIVGTFQLNSISAWRLVGHVLHAATTPQQQIEQAIDGTPPMEINIAGSIGKIAVANNTDDVTLTTGSLNSFSSGDNVVGSTFNVSGEIKAFTAGFLNGSTRVYANGPDGYIDYLATAGGLNATVNASDGIGELLVGTDLGSTDITSGNGFSELYIKHSMLKGSSVTVARTLADLVIRHGFLGGASIQARSITSKSIGGADNGTITLVQPL